jgi:hypothetical protein
LRCLRPIGAAEDGFGNTCKANGRCCKVQLRNIGASLLRSQKGHDKAIYS